MDPHRSLYFIQGIAPSAFSLHNGLLNTLRGCVCAHVCFFVCGGECDNEYSTLLIKLNPFGVRIKGGSWRREWWLEKWRIRKPGWVRPEDRKYKIQSEEKKKDKISERTRKRMRESKEARTWMLGGKGAERDEKNTRRLSNHRLLSPYVSPGIHRGHHRH